MTTGAALYPRHIEPRLAEALADTPVVLIHGPRQCGKTTLARMVGDAAGYAYVTFDDDVQLAAALADPVCQPAFNIDPGSASNIDPPVGVTFSRFLLS